MRKTKIERWNINIKKCKERNDGCAVIGEVRHRNRGLPDHEWLASPIAAQPLLRSLHFLVLIFRPTLEVVLVQDKTCFLFLQGLT